MSETIESQQEELHRAQAQERRRQDHRLLHEQLLKQNWDLREAHERSLNEMEELSEASKDKQADSSSENNVGGALFVIGLHRSVDAIALFLQDWEVAKVALSCHVALWLVWILSASFCRWEGSK